MLRRIKRSDQHIVASLLADADITLNGDGPHDLRVHDDRFYRRVLSGGSLALGESYMDGWWDTDQLDELFYRLLHSNIYEKVRAEPSAWWPVIKAKILNPQGGKRAYRIGTEHYDLGIDLFEAMLDRRMVYSCGYWANADGIHAAQEAKLDLICRKLGLQRGMRLLDIGCGWGSLVRYAVERYGVHAVGVTVSWDQYNLANAMHADLAKAEIRFDDYRNLNGVFDRIVSVGMFEHVGARNYREYMEVVNRLLAPQGLHMVHTIGRNISGRAGEGDPWIKKYIFPNSQLPSLSQITTAAEGLFVTEDVHNFGPHYDPTLMSWHERFRAAWPDLTDAYGERFRRMWEYYLLACAAAFRARQVQLWQVVFSKNPTNEYVSVR